MKSNRVTDSLRSRLTRFTFPRRMKMSGGGQFANVYAAKVRVSSGPLMVYGLPNDLSHPRLGLAVPRRVGNAIVRNTIKRRLREAFRMLQHDWPRGYDVVVNVRPHVPLRVDEYQSSMRESIARLHSTWIKKLDRKHA